ncbi:MAG TPA: hypothetical protein VLH79_13525 [Chthonomonadales bacterium]|nr:hypothetical protein [Chthonomonadales bacterium]
MASFDLSYDERTDTLRVVFEPKPRPRGCDLAVNDLVDIRSDQDVTEIRAITIRGFTTLVGVGEMELSGLRDLPSDTVARFLDLLARPPASLFLGPPDADHLVAALRVPRIEEMLAAAW